MTLVAARLGFAVPRVDDIRLVVTELGADSVEHGGGSGEPRLWTVAGGLICEVADAGRIVDPPAGQRSADPCRAGSRGLLIVNLLSDLVLVHTRAGLTVVRAHVDLPAG